jgi:hypothetical protein
MLDRACWGGFTLKLSGKIGTRHSDIFGGKAICHTDTDQVDPHHERADVRTRRQLVLTTFYALGRRVFHRTSRKPYQPVVHCRMHW